MRPTHRSRSLSTARPAALAMALATLASRPSLWRSLRASTGPSPARMAGFRSSTARTCKAGSPRSRATTRATILEIHFASKTGFSRSSMISIPSSTIRFGHLFSEHKYSNYRLRIEYRFVGDQCHGGPEWAFGIAV